MLNFFKISLEVRYVLLRDLIRQITGYNIIPANRQSPEIVDLKNTLNSLIGQIIYARRANDISNNTRSCESPCLEELIVNNFNSKRFKAKWLSSSGYPDIEIIDLTTNSPRLYIEVKVTTRQNPSSQRDFYLSPGRSQINNITSVGNTLRFDITATLGNTSSKIRGDAPHILALFKFSGIPNCPNLPPKCNCWRLESYHLYDLYPLDLNLKLEFNTNYQKIMRTCPMI